MLVSEEGVKPLTDSLRIKHSECSIPPPQLLILEGIDDDLGLRSLRLTSFLGITAESGTRGLVIVIVRGSDRIVGEDEDD